MEAKRLKEIHGVLKLTRHTDGGKLIGDGEMGPCTQAALREYQEANGLEVTGEPNDETIDHMGNLELNFPNDWDIGDLQAGLTILGFTDGGKLIGDGEMGPCTQAALREYQEANGLEVTGEPNDETIDHMGNEWYFDLPYDDE